MDMETVLSYVISLLCLCLTVFGHHVKLAIYSTETLLSGVIYNDHILEKSNVSRVLACGLLCIGNPQCVSMSYNFDEKYCQIFGSVHCSRNRGTPSSRTYYYIIGFEVSQPHNIPLKYKDTMQSSTTYDGVSKFATDGIWEDDFYVKPCSHTDLEYRPWWYVDLEKNYIIHQIKLLNRDFIHLRLRKVILSVGVNLQCLTQCGYHENPIPSAQNATIICDPPTKGRFVRIMINTTEYLTICEVAVYGQLIYR